MFGPSVRSLSALALLLALSIGCKAVTGKTLGRHIDDATITASVKTNLAADNLTKVGSLARISVKTHQGIVNLTGTVKSFEVKQRAGEIARAVDGVQGVLNHLQVEP
jgi:hyperosmotically inducible protein